MITTAAHDGFLPNDLAYAFSFFIAYHYTIYNDRQKIDPTGKIIMPPNTNTIPEIRNNTMKDSVVIWPGVEESLYNQTKDVIIKNPDIIKFNNRQKQEYSEMLAI